MMGDHVVDEKWIAYHNLLHLIHHNNPCHRHISIVLECSVQIYTSIPMTCMLVGLQQVEDLSFYDYEYETSGNYRKVNRSI